MHEEPFLLWPGKMGWSVHVELSIVNERIRKVVVDSPLRHDVSANDFILDKRAFFLLTVPYFVSSLAVITSALSSACRMSPSGPVESAFAAIGSEEELAPAAWLTPEAQEVTKPFLIASARILTSSVSFSAVREYSRRIVGTGGGGGGSSSSLEAARALRLFFGTKTLVGSSIGTSLAGIGPSIVSVLMIPRSVGNGISCPSSP